MPFYTLWFNSYDRRKYFEKKAEESGQRNLNSRKDNASQSSFIKKKDYFYEKKIESLKQELERANSELERKETVIQNLRFRLNRYNHQ